MIEAKSGLTQFSYNAFGDLSGTVDPNGNGITVTFDDLGRRTDLVDPDLGYIHYTVDAAGRTVQQVSPKQRSAGQATTTAYDLLDRMTARYEPDLESHWDYDTATKGIGQLAEAYTGTPAAKDYRRLHTYDSLGRPGTTTQVLSDGNDTCTPAYDLWARLSTQSYQRGAGPVKAFTNNYNGYGYLAAVLRGGQTLWQVTAQDAADRIAQETLGNGLAQSRTYSPYSTRMQAAVLQTAGSAVRLQEGYQYDALGSVTQRTQFWDTVSFTENFAYDELNRVTTSQVVGQALQSFTYDAAGNMASKTGVGSYTYPAQGSTAVRPHAVQSVSGLTGSFIDDCV